ASAAMMTKYQAMYVVLPAIGLFLGRSLWVAAGRARAAPAGARREAGVAIGVAAAVGLLATTPLWLKNWIWYGNPVFPFLHDVFPTHPWSADARISRDYLDGRWVTQAAGLARVG